MATRNIEVRFTPDLGEVGKALPLLAKRLLHLVERGIEENARIMAEALRQTTPRSEHQDVFFAAAKIAPPGGHMADGWTSRRVDAEIGEFAVEVYNKDPRANAPLRLSSGGETTVLHILEYGSRPHVITPVFADRLVFFWPAIGAIVRAKRVEHPGTKPYAMVALATNDAVSRAQRLLAAAARVAQDFISGAAS